ncbi:MAG: hypothetical protein OHK0044_03760 [Burkholderiaceae bacterium]
MAATDGLRRLRMLLSRLLGFAGGLAALTTAKAVDLPENRADLMFHGYDGGGVRATGPALLVRKSMLDRVSLSASYYADIVSNASIDVVTQASPYKETRNEYAVGLDYAVRDALISLSASTSREPDYRADAVSLDVSQETFGGMTTVALGFTRARDKVGRKDRGFFDDASHWRYRVGVTQILTPRWLASANLEAVSDDGFLGSPYRAARVFGAFVPERNPRTRSSRAVKLRTIGEIAARQSVRAEYRYYWDNWDIRSHTAEVGYARHFGEQWLADAYLRYYTQRRALFYSDNATAETLYVSRNRQLGTYTSVGLGAKLAYTWRRVPGRYEVRLHGALERSRFDFTDFTDIRTGSPYAYDANVVQVFVSATF